MNLADPHGAHDEETTMNKEAYALIEENAATLKTRFDAVSYLLGYYGEIDAEIMKPFKPHTSAIL